MAFQGNGRKVDIRKISAGELEVVRELALAIWPGCYRNIIGPDRVDAMLAVLYATDALEKEMVEEGHVFWVARFADRDVGYASAYRDGERLWLKKLYVRDDHRGHGIGKALTEAALDYFAAGARQLVLYVNRDNTPAIDYYLRSGFTIAAEVPVTMGPYDFTDYMMQRDI
ncbi:GNAT family N-acetyltransferase [Asticcacaulis solisilvae]|uniref:GNAT family N-acetyltransferase n=1 Tax=Asticcacaulis solisilvae TaxID=1217274 RepID=UPI003FD82CCE